MAGGGAILAAAAGIGTALLAFVRLPGLGPCRKARGCHAYRHQGNGGRRWAPPSALSSHDKQQNQSEHHHDQAADANLMWRPVRYFSERLTPPPRKKKRENTLQK